MTQHAMTFSEEERGLIISALEVLDPDSDEGYDTLELLTQKFMSHLEEEGEVDFDLDDAEVVMLRDALDILNPDDFDVMDSLEDLRDVVTVVANQIVDDPSP